MPPAADTSVNGSRLWDGSTVDIFSRRDAENRRLEVAERCRARFSRLARLQTQHHQEPRHPQGGAIAANQRLCFEWQCHVERASDVGAEEPRRRHADDRDGHAIHNERSADDAGGAAEAALPEGVADHRDRPLGTATGAIVGRRERAAEHRGYAERREVAAAGEQPIRELALTTRRKVEARRRPGERAVEEIDVRLQFLPHREGPAKASGESAGDRRIGGDRHEPVRIGDG